MKLADTKGWLQEYGLEFLSEVHPRDLMTSDVEPAGRLPEGETVLPAGTELVRSPSTKLWAKDDNGKIILVCFA